ncbi:MAG TPA: DUF4124 domain-containing protein [Steroidobacteraceae bacterium]|jgi:hypothetical protein|nr:DUF4124 domain-containing protein [Steroidobacteraceae bacterium]
MNRALITLLLVALPLGAQADVYRSVDAQGHVQYSDTPSPGAQLVTSADETASPSSGDVDRNAAQAQKINDQIHDRVAHQTAAEQTAKDTAAAHEQQCNQAKVAYQNAIQARHLYSMSPDGQRTYLSDDQADQQRVRYREAMEAACADSDSQ